MLLFSTSAVCQNAPTEEVVAVDSASRFSTFYGLYMPDALSMAGMYDKALDIIDAPEGIRII